MKFDTTSGVHGRPRANEYRGKRAFDIVVALAAILCSLPIMLLVALAVRTRLGTPVLFFQERPGLDGRIFRMMKFRSMTDARDAQGTLLPDSKRLTRFGKLLRSTSLDELPELFNVLKGEMSIVGPRPLFTHYLPLYSSRQARRHEVKPGITGWAQVHGRNNVQWDERFELDVWYVDHGSLLLDVKVLLLTVWMVIRKEGINPDGKTEMEHFAGNNELLAERILYRNSVR